MILSKMLQLCKNHLTSMVLLSFICSGRKASFPVPGEGGAGGQGAVVWGSTHRAMQCLGRKWSLSLWGEAEEKGEDRGIGRLLPPGLLPSMHPWSSASRTAVRGVEMGAPQGRPGEQEGQQEDGGFQERH